MVKGSPLLLARRGSHSIGRAARRSCAACASGARRSWPRRRSSAARPIRRCSPTARSIEGAGGAGQLDLAMQRLVGDAEQGAVGHAQSIALRGQRAALHVHRNGARQVDPPPLLRPAQLPVAVVVGDHRAGAQPLLQRIARARRSPAPPPPAGRPDLGECRDRHLRRHQVVEDAVAAQIAVREHVVADHLRRRRPPQWPIISQQCGRRTARWSVMFFAFDGPTPILTMLTPSSPSRRSR